MADLMPSLDELGTRILLSISAATLLIGATTNQPTCDNIASSQHLFSSFTQYTAESVLVCEICLCFKETTHAVKGGGLGVNNTFESNLLVFDLEGEKKTHIIGTNFCVFVFTFID